MIGERLKEVREKAGLNQAEFAKIVGVSVATYSTYELGKSSPRSEAIVNVCNTFNVSADWLLGVGADTYPLRSWGDIANYLSPLVKDYFLVKKCEFLYRFGMQSADYGCTALLIPDQILYDYFKLAESISGYSIEAFEAWRKGALISSPMTDEVPEEAWSELLKNLLNDELYLNLSDHA